MELKARIEPKLPEVFYLELNGERLKIQAGEIFWKKLGALPAKLSELQKKAGESTVTEKQAVQRVRRLLGDLLGEQIEEHLQGKSIKELAILTVEITRQFSRQIRVRTSYGS